MHLKYTFQHSNTLWSVIIVVILACSPGEYGRNCQFRCSDYCHNNEVCDAFFGNCSKCADGFQKAKCDKRKFIFIWMKVVFIFTDIIGMQQYIFFFDFACCLCVFFCLLRYCLFFFLWRLKNVTVGIMERVVCFNVDIA